MTAGREDGTAGEPGQLRTSHADRDQAINLLKAAFVQGRLTKHEFDLRVGQVLASRTYADLRALTADIPSSVASAGGGRARPGGLAGRSASRRRPALAPSAPSRAWLPPPWRWRSRAECRRWPACLLVGLTGVLVTVLLAALLVVLSWAVRRSQRAPEQGPPSGPVWPGVQAPGVAPAAADG